MDVPAHHHHHLGGRACRRDALVRHYFGQYVGGDRLPINWLPFDLQSAQRWTDPSSCGARLWHVGGDATEIFRSVDAPVAPLSRQAFAQFVGPVTGGGTRTQNRSLAKFYVTMNNFGGQHRFFMDANQSIELYSDCITMDLVLPDNYVEIPPMGLEVVRGPGLVSDIQIGAFQWEIEESRGRTEVTYTTFHPNELETQVIAQVPPFAISCVIYQNSQGAASTAWTGWAGLPPGGVELMSIPFIPGGRKTEPEILLPSVTHLQSDVDANADRFFTIQWTIRP